MSSKWFLLTSLTFTTRLLAAGPQVETLYTQTPLRFEPNVGQAGTSVPYMARGAGFRMLLTGDQAVLALDAGSSLHMRLEGAQAPAAAEPQDRLPSVSNYYIGNDPQHWHANVPNYGRVKFSQVYPGIDIVYYGNQQRLEYDLIVAPGADPAQIRWAYSGAESIRLDAEGDLVLAVGGHQIRQRKPTIYQEVAGRRREVRGEYALAQGGKVRLALGGYDSAAALVIDPPVLVYSTYLGGSGTDAGTDIAVDGSGAAYVTGETNGNFPTLNPYQGNFNTTNNAFVAKFSAAGALVYATYLSGSAESEGYGITVDSSGQAYVAGRTAGGNFPLLNPTQSTYGGGPFDAFLAKLNTSGGLAYSTYLGGGGDDEAGRPAVDSSGNMYLTGFTSGSFPTLNAAQGTYGGGTYDGFAVKLTPYGGLTYSTYIGGSGQDQAVAVAVDASGAAYICGTTQSSNFPTLNPIQAVYGGGTGNAFLVKLSSTGARQYATYLGGPVHDVGWGVGVDSSGAAYIAGITEGGFPTVNAAQPTFGGGNSDAFVAKVSPSGSSLLYSTYLGGAGSEIAYRIGVDPTGAAYVAGQTTGSFPVQNALQSTFGGGGLDAFVAELSPSGGVVYATYLGGAGPDYALAIAVDSAGAAYVTGEAGAGFPTVSPYQATFGGAIDVFVAKIGPAAAIATSQITAIFPDTAVAGGASFTLSLEGSGFTSGAVVSWNGTPLTTSFGSSQSLSASVLAPLIATAGVALVTVTNPGESSSSAVSFSIVASPVVPTLTSATVDTYGFTCTGVDIDLMTVTGSGFQPGVAFYWNGTQVPGGPFNVNVPLTLMTPGTATITASNGGAMSNGVSVIVPSATLMSISPNTAAAGSGSLTLTATGTNFTSGSHLQGFPCPAGVIGGSTLINQQFISSTQIQATIPASSLTTAGSFPVWFSNSSGGNLFSSPNNLTFTVTGSGPQYLPQGSKLVGTGGVSSSDQGQSVALSSDGNTAIVGGYNDNGSIGAAWIFTRSGGVWTQQGGKLVGTGGSGSQFQGFSVAISGDGNTALVGGSDPTGAGTAWVFTRSGGVWTQQGSKLVGTGTVVGSGGPSVGFSVALSSDGNTAAMGVSSDNNLAGAVWVFTRSGTVWTQQGNKLVGTGAVGIAEQGGSVALSGDSNTLLVGGRADNNGAGATWVFTRSGSAWTQQGNKLVGTGALTGPSGVGTLQGFSVALSSDGNTAVESGAYDNTGAGAIWAFTRSGGVWTQQGAKLVGTGAVGAAQQGTSLSLSLDGNTFVAGGLADNSGMGAAWVFTRSGTTWSQLGTKLVGTGVVGSADQGIGVSISGNAGTVLVGGYGDNSNTGAAWPFVISGPAPSITTLSPTSATAGGSAFTLTVNGANFLSGAVVNWNSTPLSTTVVSASQLTASVPATLIVSAGTASITVTNPDGKASAASSFPITGSVTITGPSSLPAGTVGLPYPATTITVSGGVPPYAFSASIPSSELTIGPSGILSGTPAATFSGTVTITVKDINGATASQSYSLTIGAALSIACTPSPLSFTFTIGGMQFASESCSVTSSPSGVSVSASATTTAGLNWLTASLSSGTTPLNVTVSATILGLAAGSYSGTVQVTDGGAPYNLPVSLTLNPGSQVTFTLTPTSASAPATPSTGTTSLTLVPTASTTSWTASSTASWLHITSPSGGAGSGAATISYSLDPNTGAARTGTFNVSSGGNVVATFTVNQAGVSCTALTVSPTSFTFGSSGGSGVLNFNTASCPWTASSSNPSLVSVPASGSTGTLTFTVAAGTTASIATITIPSTVTPTVITINRAAPVCTYTIATHGAIGVSLGFVSGGGTGSVDVTAPAGCSWTASANNSFLSVTSGATGSGSGTVNYSVSSNASTTAARAGTLTVAGVTYTISQVPQGTQSYSCTVSGAAPSSMRAEGIAELAGDLVVTCSGVSSGGVTGDLVVTLNTSLTNHTLSTDHSGQTTDALLLKDNPSSTSLTLAGSGQNAYRGVISGPLAVRFKNVSLAPETGSFSHVFRITNVRVDASHLGASGTVTAAVSILSTAPFSVTNASQTVGSIQAGSSFSVGSPSPAPTGLVQPITFSEKFLTAYRVKVASNQDPSVAGTIYNSESGYVNSSVLGTETGFANNGTRLVARFANIPTGTLVYAPATQGFGSATAVLVSADANGTGGSAMQGSAQVPGYQPVALANGAGTATWEITASSPTTLDSLTFNLLVTNPALVLQSSCAAGSAPSVCGALGPQVAVSAPSNTAPTPRFVNPTLPAVSQVTRLSIAPLLTGGQTGGTIPARSGAVEPLDVPAHRSSIFIPAASGSGNTVAVGGTVTIGELLQSDANSPPVTGACVGTTLPPSYTITACSADNGGTCTPTGGNSISTCYPNFDPGQSSTINVVADTTDTSGSAELDSNAITDSGDFGAGSFTQILAVAPGPTITLSFQGPSGVAAGQQITYTVSLNNNGAAKLAGDPMITTIALDPTLTGVSTVTDPTSTCSQTGVTITCSNSSAVASKGQIGFTVTGTVPSGTGAGTIVSTSATLTLGGQASAPQAVNTSVGQGLPVAPILSLPANGATSVPTATSLNWSASAGATSYDVYLGTSNPPPMVFNTTALTYVTPTLSPGTVYFWQINARNTSGTTPSTTWSFTTAGGTVSGYRFVPVTPCRVMDTRNATGTFGGPSIAGGATRNVPIPQSACGIPSTAQAYSLNITVVPPGPLTYLTVWPAGQSQPVVSTLNSLDGRIVANAAIVPAGSSGAISVFASNTTNVIIDINGYFAPVSTAGSMSFYSATPCRIVDTRNPTGAFGGPFMSGGSTRSFAIPSSSCAVPATAQAYSLNITVVPHQGLQYLTTWPTGQSQPLVSTLNSLDGSIVANAAIVPAGTSGAVSVFATNDTDVIIDINGYFAPPGSTGALSLYTLAPCRVADTRGATGPFGGPSLAANSTRIFAVPSSGCSVPLTAQAYSLNVTAVPPGTLTYLTAWATGQSQPVVSTLNSLAGKVVANAAIVPAGATGPGAISIFVSNTTDVILDINAYFAQ